MASNQKRGAADSLPQKAAIYIRVSTVHQVDKASLPVQQNELINYARYALNISNYAIFQDAGYSAKNTDRPDYQQMMSRVRMGEFSHILVWKIDRISRNLLDFATMYSELKKLGVIFVSKNEQFDTSSAMGEAMLKIILVFAELERNMTSERVSAVMLSRANDGVWNGGRIPYGYDYDKKTKTFTINEGEERVVRFIYDRYEATGSLLKVAKELNEKSVPASQGGAWNPVAVHHVLTNPFYSGTYRYNYRDETKSHTFETKPQNEWVLVENHHPAIVTQERQQAVVNLLKSRQRGKYGQTFQRKHIHIFAGLLTCGCCGSPMIATIDRERADGWRPSIYLCSRHRRFNDCPNKYVSDITLGPFVFNFIHNLIKVSKSFGKSTSIETLEKKLLRGEVFSRVDHIERPGLEELFNHLKSKYDNPEYTPTTVKAAESSAEVQERDTLLSEKRRLERALNRLKTIYLYDDAGIPDKDYLIERKEILDRIEEVDSRLEYLSVSSASALSMSDEEFIAKASYFILAQQLEGKRYINYEHFVRRIDPQIVKDFLNSIVTNFCIKDGRTSAILFKNGLEIKFSYKAQ